MPNGTRPTPRRVPRGAYFSPACQLVTIVSGGPAVDYTGGAAAPSGLLLAVDLLGTAAPPPNSGITVTYVPQVPVTG